jgi:alpha-tubulin suppressor-like RCC1 family protein
LTPKRIEAVANVRVVAGDLHSMLLTEAGAVYSFGCGEEGQLGHSDMEHQSTPRMIEALRGVNVTAIAAGSATSLAVAAGRTAYGWGSGSEEDTTLGLGLSEAQLTPLQYPSAQLRVRVVG